ncbi:glycosyl hydrolase [Puia sp. P3]|uniref:glycosyl hydrolase n=1 Tax=Puia sp. P3 TaxID=3423952 RepID=UPI003D665947
MLLRNKILVFLLLLNGAVMAQSFDSATFVNPPEAARPWVFWYWMQAAVSREGIRADLQAMKEVGIGGAYLMPINGAGNPPIYEPAVQQLSPLWWDMVKYAMKVADSLGVKLAMHACDGFAVAGGPWISPARSMQKVVWTRVGVDGGGWWICGCRSRRRLRGIIKTLRCWPIRRLGVGRYRQIMWCHGFRLLRGGCAVFGRAGEEGVL